MRNLPGNANRKLGYLLFALIAIGFSSCNSDDQNGVDDFGGVTPQPTGSINAEDQTLSGNTLEVTSVTVSTNAWLVVKKLYDDGFTVMIADPVLIQTGTLNNFDIELDNTNAANVELVDGDTLVLMLHADDGDSVFEYQGNANTGQDMPIKDADGIFVTETVVISSPYIEIEDQDVEDNSILFANVSTRSTGWIVVYNSTAMGTINEKDIIGYTFLEEGGGENIRVSFYESFHFTPGQTLFTRLHQDHPNDGKFTYRDNEDSDIAEIFGFGSDPRITRSLVINDDDVATPEPRGTITAEDQTLSRNELLVKKVTVSTNTWLVVKKVNEDGSLTDIIAEPELITTSRRENMEIKLSNSHDPDVDLEDGDTLLLMIHADDGDGVFEFEGETGQDIPIRNVAGEVVTETIVIYSPSIEVEDQDVENNTITFTKVSARKRTWIVVYNSTVTGTINEDEILGYKYLEGGNNADVEVTFLAHFTPGQTVFARIHLEDPYDLEFTYLDYPKTDLPEIFGFGVDPTITKSVIIN